MDQFDGALIDEDMDDSNSPEEEKGEPEKHPDTDAHPTTHSSASSSTDSDKIIDKVVETTTQNMYEKCSGEKDHSNCWPQEYIIATPEPSAAPKES